MGEELPQMSAEELRARVLYSLLGVAAKFARLSRFTLKQVTDWMEVVYFHEVKRSGFTQKEAADLFGVSQRKVSQLASRLKQNFLKSERQVKLPRKIEFMLWAGPLSEGRIRQSLDGYTADEIEHALQRLVEDDRAIREDGRTTYYRVPDSEFRLYQDDWLSRLDGLNNHLTNVVDGIYARFFGGDEDQAFARTVNFRIRRERMDELEKLYQEVIFPRLRELDMEAKESSDEETADVGLSYNWAPDEYCSTRDS